MSSRRRKFDGLFAATLALAVMTAGCSQPTSTPTPNDELAKATPGGEAKGHEGHDHDHSGKEDPTHGGWWCYEHAVPEEQCAMCDSDLAAKLREKGDWCEEHSRPDSLCFKCHPENAKKFVALFEAKYGKKPPEATD